MNDIFSDHDIESVLSEYGVSADQALCRDIRTYTSLLLRWNRRVALTAVTDPMEILRFHFGESLFAASAVPVEDGRLADIGSGAGFPGLPLRMMRPELEVVLIEPNSKKAAFLSEIIRQLNLDHANVFRGRMEEVRAEEPTFDLVTARAVGRHEDLLVWSRAHLRGGKVVLWLGQEDASAISRSSGWEWTSPLRIPGSIGRYILAGSPRS
jgi:16S rRNA (guanine527-N7)-methyltransferase